MLLRRLDEALGDLGFSDGARRIAPIDGQRAMPVAFIGRAGGSALKRDRVGLDMRQSLVMMSLTAVDQLTMLGASGMLDQEHVTSARALQKQSEQACEDASTPNY